MKNLQPAVRSRYLPLLCVGLRVTPSTSPYLLQDRDIGWWLPPGGGRGGAGGAWWDEGDYVHITRLEADRPYHVEVQVEGRDVVIKGGFVESSRNRHYEHSFVRRHRLPDDVDPRTVVTGFTDTGDFVITAKYYNRRLK